MRHASRPGSGPGDAAPFSLLTKVGKTHVTFDISSSGTSRRHCSCVSAKIAYFSHAISSVMNLEVGYNSTMNEAAAIHINCMVRRRRGKKLPKRWQLLEEGGLFFTQVCCIGRSLPTA